MMIIYKNLRYIPGFTSTKTIAPDFVRRYVTVGDRLRRWIFHSIKTKSAGSAFVLNTKCFILHAQHQYIRQAAFQCVELKIYQAGNEKNHQKTLQYHVLVLNLVPDYDVDDQGHDQKSKNGDKDVIYRSGYAGGAHGTGVSCILEYERFARNILFQGAVRAYWIRQR